MTEALLESREDIMLAIPSLSVGCRNNVLLLSFERWKMFMWIFYAFFVVSVIEAK